MPSITDQANVLAAQGRVSDALALMNERIRANDHEALFCLALWHLIGTNVPRNLPEARALLRRAASLGNADAAMMEVALIANGSGGKPDWGLAYQRLIEAAVSNPLAHHQMQMLTTICLDQDGYPPDNPPGRRLCEKPIVSLFPALLTPAECAHLAMAARDLLEPTTVFDPSTGQLMRHPVRTSSGAVIGPTREDLVIQAINRRFAKISGSRIEQGEPISILHYAPGEQYRPHFDFITNSLNQRLKTIIVYLNQGYTGGATQFLANGVTVQGKIGDAIMFDNVDETGARDALSQHAGLPVVSGTKWIATRWIRQDDFNPWENA